MKQHTGKFFMNACKALQITLVALLFSGCAVSKEDIARNRLITEQMRLAYKIAETRNDGKPVEPTTIIQDNTIIQNNIPRGRCLIVNIQVAVKSTWLGLRGKMPEQEEQRCESECIRIIENFRKAGLPSEFALLRTGAHLPDNWEKGGFDWFSSSSSALCGFEITREELTNGSPPRQTIKNFKFIKQ